MNRIAPAFLALAALGALEAMIQAPPLAAQSASLVKDIAPGSDSTVGSSPDNLWSLNGKVLFAAREASTGRELWITDGSASGTRLLADFCQGECSSSPRALGMASSLLFGISFEQFDNSGSDPTQGYLWRSDGTREGTFLLPDPSRRITIPFPENGSSTEGSQAPLVFAQDAVYFAGCRRYDDCSLWTSDGTAAGTSELRGAAGSPSPQELVLTGGRLFISNSRQLWISDGTAAGTTLVKDFQYPGPHHLTASAEGEAAPSR